MAAAEPPLIVTRLVENDRHHPGDYTHSVRVDMSRVEWRMLLGDVARATVARYGVGILAKMLAAGDPARGAAERQDALTRWVAALGVPRWHILLDPHDALALAAELDEAAEEPRDCTCGRVVDVHGGDNCGVCLERLDRRGLRAVGG